jgi:citrate lyase alpha subunit
MSNAWYPTGLAAVFKADVDILVDTIKAALVDDTYTYSAAHDFYNDVSAYVLDTPVALSGRSVTAGEFFADDVTFTAVAAGDTVGGVVIYKDTGVAGTSALLGFAGRQADSVPIARDTTGGDITLTWPSGRVLKI